MSDTSVLTLRYAYAYSCIESDVSEDIFLGVNLLNSQTSETRFPLIYYGLARGYIKQNR